MYSPNSGRSPGTFSPGSRGAGLQRQWQSPPPRAAPAAPSTSFWQKYKGWIIFLIVVALIVTAVATGVLSAKVNIKSCAGGTPGVGKDKEKGCLCNIDDECSSKKCDFGFGAALSGAAKGKCS